MKKEELKALANKLMFDMDDVEYETLASEFETIIKQMDLIGEIKGIDKVEPMSFPFVTNYFTLRDDEDEDGNTLTTEEVLMNASSVASDAVKVPKVVE